MSTTSTAWLILTWVRPGPAIFLVLPLLTPTPYKWSDTPHPSHYDPSLDFSPPLTLFQPVPWTPHPLSMGPHTCLESWRNNRSPGGPHFSDGERRTVTAPELCGDHPATPYPNPSAFHCCTLNPHLSSEASHHASSHLTSGSCLCSQEREAGKVVPREKLLPTPTTPALVGTRGSW